MKLQLRAWRKQRGLTQRTLAHAIGLKTSASIHFYEAGLHDPPGSRLLAIAEVLGVSIGDLFRLPEGVSPADAPPPTNGASRRAKARGVRARRRR